MSDLVENFLRAQPEYRFDLARRPEYADALRRLLGEQAFQEYLGLGPGGDTHLGRAAPRNLVVVPGVMGSLLASTAKGGIWWVDVRTRAHIDDLRLSPDGESDHDPDNAVEPVATDPSYEPFLTAVLARDDVGHVMFPYDWRKPLAHAAVRFCDLVVDLFHRNRDRPVHVVAHSMGGLVVRLALHRYGNKLWPCVDRIAFVGTPHYGSPAIARYLKKHLGGFEMMALLGRYLSRATFRSMWGVLGMLPAPRGIYPGTRDGDPAPWTGDAGSLHPCANFDMYSVPAWRLDLEPGERDTLQAILDGATAQHRQLDDWHRRLPQHLRDRMAVIAGVGFRTIFRVSLESGLLGLGQHVAVTKDREPGDPHREGDGRVPLASARLSDVPTWYVRGVHGGLLNIPAVGQAALAWATGQTPDLPDSPQAALGAHLAELTGSAAPHLDGTNCAAPFSDDPGIIADDDPDEEILDLLDRRAATGELPDFIRVRLL